MPAFDKRVKDFEAVNTQVLGISTDSPFSHDNWAKSVGISNYPLLSDIHRTAAKDYGVYWPDWNANTRATFIVDKGGKVRVIQKYGKGELPSLFIGKGVVTYLAAKSREASSGSRPPAPAGSPALPRFPPARAAAWR